MLRDFFRMAVFLPIILILISCGGYKQVQFPVYGTNAVLLSQNRLACEGTPDFSKQEKVEYRFDDNFLVPQDSSFQIEYDISMPQEVKEKYILVLNTGADSWELPIDTDAIYFYAVPVDASFNGTFSFLLQSAQTGGSLEKTDKKSVPVVRIRSISFTDRFFGFHASTANTERTNIVLTPFVQRQESSYVIDIPDSVWSSHKFAGINAVFSAETAALEFSGRRFETFPGTQNISFSPSIYSEQGRAVIFAQELESFLLFPRRQPTPFPQPITADTALVISFPTENWRNSNYEIFRWDRFNNILIFDYADYGVQDRMLKRLAFYVEKAGFRGRLAHDEEIAHLHGWNAHDYRAEDLARFFDTARKTNFPLLAEEIELEEILLNEKIILKEQGSIVPGNGAIISIARESPEYLRYRLMVHEAFHGLYFIDKDFRDFSRQRWEQLSDPAKRFLIAYFDLQQYDTTDEYLLLNEFMAHVLQQPVSQAADYFGRNLPLRLESTRRASALPQKDSSSGTWPQLAAAFTAEAEAFSAYVNRRWGLAAGRVWALRVR